MPDSPQMPCHPQFLSMKFRILHVVCQVLLENSCTVIGVSILLSLFDLTEEIFRIFKEKCLLTKRKL